MLLTPVLIFLGLDMGFVPAYSCPPVSEASPGHPSEQKNHKEGNTMSNSEPSVTKLIADSNAQVILAEIGKPAPEFMTEDIKGEHVMLSDYKGKIVVLEWTNHQCPYVRKHYDTGNMQSLQQEATQEGVVWISIVSSAKGKEGNVSPQEAQSIIEKEHAFPTYKILDESGAIGRLYGAKSTPHMFVIDKSGVLVYSGAIDSNESFKPETIKGAKNYVREAINALKEGRAVEVVQTQPYGCGVKY